MTKTTTSFSLSWYSAFFRVNWLLNNRNLKPLNWWLFVVKLTQFH